MIVSITDQGHTWTYDNMARVHDSKGLLLYRVDKGIVPYDDAIVYDNDILKGAIFPTAEGPCPCYVRKPFDGVCDDNETKLTSDDVRALCSRGSFDLFIPGKVDQVDSALAGDFPFVMECVMVIGRDRTTGDLIQLLIGTGSVQAYLMNDDAKTIRRLG